MSEDTSHEAPRLMTTETIAALSDCDLDGMGNPPEDHCWLVIKVPRLAVIEAGDVEIWTPT